MSIKFWEGFRREEFQEKLPEAVSPQRDEPADVMVVEPEKVETVELPQPPPRPRAELPSPSESIDHISQYVDLARDIGFFTPDAMIPAFEHFLKKMDFPVFNLSEVIAYMDDKAMHDNPHKLGWEWKPLREKDRRPKIGFGSASWFGNGFHGSPIPASDYYSESRTPPVEAWPSTVTMFNQSNHTITYDAHVSVYDKLVPMHALKKVALIEREFTGDVAFFVSDYVTSPHIIATPNPRPDPFLMAVIANGRAREGIGRFVLDIWDEPGFGIERMVK